MENTDMNPFVLEWPETPPRVRPLSKNPREVKDQYKTDGQSKRADYERHREDYEKKWGDGRWNLS